MRKLELFSLGFTVVCVLDLMAVMAGASAAELPEFSTNPGVLHLTSGVDKLFSEGSSVGCTADRGLFALYPSSKNLGTFDINFAGCEQKKRRVGD